MGETLFVEELPVVRHRVMGIVRGITWVGVISMISITGYTIYLEGISADRWLLHHVHQETADMRNQPVEHTVSWPSGGISAFPAAAGPYTAPYIGESE